MNTKQVVKDIDVKIMSDIEHIRHRIEMYAGNASLADHSEFIVENESIIKADVTYAPALVKIISEILDNCIDEHNRESVKNVWFNYDYSTGKIVIEDDGGIPVKIHEASKKYIPEVIFSILRTSTNYNDSEKTSLIGTNGLGAKLTAVCSKYFTIDTSDGVNRFVQKYTDGLTNKSKPKITETESKGTRIEFIPDYELFSTTLEDTDFLKVIHFYLLTLAINYNKCNIYYNDELLDSKFKSFINMLGTDNMTAVTPNWQLAIILNTEFNQLSFVNGVNTKDGGVHVDCINNQLCELLAIHMKKKDQLEVKASVIKNYYMLYVSCRVVKPKFDSQSKTRLISGASHFNIDPSDIIKAVFNNFITTEMYTTLVDQLKYLRDAKDAKLVSKLEKTNKSIVRSIGNYIDCSGNEGRYLYLCEGDSAAAPLISVRDPNKHAIFKLKGRPINAYELSYKELLCNVEFANLIKIFSYYNYEFDKIIIASDADEFGNGICGLLMANIYTHIPQLIDKLYRLRTPQLIVTQDKNETEFFNMQDFNIWYNALSEFKKKKTKVDYYKGLGTFETKSFEKFLADDNYLTKLVPDAQALAQLELVFSKNKDSADNRKKWLRSI